MTRSFLLRCPKCMRYTLSESCPECKAGTRSPLPPKYSPEDPYGEYRRRLKKMGPAGGRSA